jgi:hypothetical protein
MPMSPNLKSEKILVGPVVASGDVVRLIKEPNGSLRIEMWEKRVGWITAPEGSMMLAEFMPGATRPISARDRARLGIPASEL